MLYLTYFVLCVNLLCKAYFSGNLQKRLIILQEETTQPHQHKLNSCVGTYKKRCVVTWGFCANAISYDRKINDILKLSL